MATKSYLEAVLKLLQHRNFFHLFICLCQALIGQKLPNYFRALFTCPDVIIVYFLTAFDDILYRHVIYLVFTYFMLHYFVFNLSQGSIHIVGTRFHVLQLRF